MRNKWNDIIADYGWIFALLVIFPTLLLDVSSFVLISLLLLCFLICFVSIGMQWADTREE